MHTIEVVNTTRVKKVEVNTPFEPQVIDDELGLIGIYESTPIKGERYERIIRSGDNNIKLNGSKGFRQEIVTRLVEVSRAKIKQEARIRIFAYRKPILSDTSEEKLVE